MRIEYVSKLMGQFIHKNHPGICKNCKCRSGQGHEQFDEILVKEAEAKKVKEEKEKAEKEAALAAKKSKSGKQKSGSKKASEKV